MKILDVGCGSKPWGNINLDLNVGKSKHHKFSYDVKQIKNFTRGDATSLPFKNKSIDVLIARHCLEHIPEPLKAVIEFERVTREKIIIMVPNNPTNTEFKTHIYSWSLVSLKNFLNLVFENVEVYPNSPFSDLYKMRSLRPILGKSYYKFPLNRLIGSLFGFQLTAIVRL